MPLCCPAAAWSQGVCLEDVIVSDSMTGGSEQPRRGPEWLAEAKQTCVLSASAFYLFESRP